jgi:hypothetical protein
MGRGPNGQAIVAARRKPREVERLRELLREATVLKDLAMWRRAKCVLGYMEGRSAIDLAKEVGVDRSPSRNGSVGTTRKGRTAYVPDCCPVALRD